MSSWLTTINVFYIYYEYYRVFCPMFGEEYLWIAKSSIAYWELYNYVTRERGVYVVKVQIMELPIVPSHVQPLREGTN